MDRVGIWGHSGGGYATASAMFRYPDFFKVGISESGNHDNRALRRRLGREVAGPADAEARTARPTTTTRPISCSAKNLKGKLLLAHGTLDANVPPYNTLLVVEELIKADKDFDLIMLPNEGQDRQRQRLHDVAEVGLLHQTSDGSRTAKKMGGGKRTLLYFSQRPNYLSCRLPFDADDRPDDEVAGRQSSDRDCARGKVSSFLT